MKKGDQNMTKDRTKYHRCHACGSMTSENFVGENGKIECRHIVSRNHRYEICGFFYNVAEYNTFVETRKGSGIFERICIAKKRE